MSASSRVFAVTDQVSTRVVGLHKTQNRNQQSIFREFLTLNYA